MSKISEKIKGMLIQEILNQVEVLGTVYSRISYGDDNGDVTVKKESVLLEGYTAEILTSSFEAEGLNILSRERYDQSSEIANSQEVLARFSISDLAKLYENGEYQLENKNKQNHNIHN